jgi:hypothetical protein
MNTNKMKPKTAYGPQQLNAAISAALSVISREANRVISRLVPQRISLLRFDSWSGSRFGAKPQQAAFSGTRAKRLVTRFAQNFFHLRGQPL